MNDNADNDPRSHAIPDIHGHAKGEHKAFTDERPIPLSARMLFLWFYHACKRGWPRFLMVTDHMNYLTFEDPAAINLVRRALKLAQAGDLYGAAETASVEVGHAAVVSEGLRRGMHYSIGAEVDNDPRSRPDAQNIVDAMKPDGMIRSVHFLTIDHPTHGPNWNWPFDNPEFIDTFDVVGTAKTWELYMATLLDAVERLPGNILGHFYVPAVFGHWPDDAVLEGYEDRIVEACEARGMAIELNTRFLYRDHSEEEKAKYLAAHRRLIAKCKAKNVGIAVGSDAHSPKDQGRAFETVLALLDECEVNELVFPIAGRLARVALRVERKPEPPAPEPIAVPAPTDERKAVRKPRTSEAPVRARETSSRRDEDAAGDDVPAGDDAASKPKPRPKRSKSRAADSGESRAAGTETGPDTPPADPAAPVAAAPAEAASSDQELHPPAAPIEAPATAGNPAPAAVASEVEPPQPDLATTAPSAADSAHSEAPAEPDRPTPAVADGDAGLLVGSSSEAHDVGAPVTASEPAESVAEAASASDSAAEVDGDGTVGATDPAPASAPVDPVLAVHPVATQSVRAAAPARKAQRKPPAAKAKATGSSAKSKAPAKAKAAPKKIAKPPARATAKKAAAKKSSPKKAAAKKSPAPKAGAKKAPAKKAAPRSAPGKKALAKKTAGKKPTAKKAASKRR